MNLKVYLYNFVNVLQSSLMLYGGSSQEAEANALTPAKRQGTTIFNLEKHYDENSAIRNPCSTRIKKEKTEMLFYKFIFSIIMKCFFIFDQKGED